MKLYEVINPSDAVTFEAESDDVAAIAVLFLGRGKYGCTDEQGSDVLPLLLFGSDGWIEKFCADRKLADLSDFLSANAEALAKALESTSVCSLANRKALVAAVGPDPVALERWNEAKRSSLNNICAAARKLAAAFRKPRAAKAGKP